MKIKEKFQAAIIILALVAIGASRAAAQQPTVQARVVQPVAVTGNLIDPARAIDNQLNTRATSGTSDYRGMNITLDIGGEQNIIGAIQDHGRWPPNYPGAYRVEVGAEASGPWLQTFEGPGNRGESKAIFEAVRGRFVRITATATNGGGPDWTIAELKAIIDPGAKARRIPVPDTRPPGDTKPPSTGKAIKDLALAFDKNPNTRATSGTPDYEGMSFTFDLGGEYEISRVVQIHGAWPEDYPAKYQVEVSRQRDESRFREVWQGRGERGRSVAEFQPIATRYIRITALQRRDNTHWWSIAELRTNRDEAPVDDDDKADERQVRSITGKGLSNLTAAIDQDPNTRAISTGTDYAGSSVVLDLGGSYTIKKVVQVHEPNDRDFPGRYTIEVSEDGRNWRMAFEGQGEEGRSRATFEPVRARYVRITATASRDRRHPWSFSKIRVLG
jgi:F5/8 type C domain-containing protein